MRSLFALFLLFLFAFPAEADFHPFVPGAVAPRGPQFNFNFGAAVRGFSGHVYGNSFQTFRAPRAVILRDPGVSYYHAREAFLRAPAASYYYAPAPLLLPALDPGVLGCPGHGVAPSQSLRFYRP